MNNALKINITRLLSSFFIHIIDFCIKTVYNVYIQGDIYGNNN